MVKKINSKLSLAAVMQSLSLMLGFLVISFSVSAATIQVKTDRNPVGLNESFQLVYESSDSVDGDPDFSPLEKYLDILNRNQSSNVSIINGRYSSSKTWTLSVMARQVGVIVLPPIMFGSDQSASLKITVKEPAKNQQNQSSFYTRIRVDQQQVYAQQQLVITQQLFSDKNLSAYGMGELDFNGMDVISQPLGEEKQYKTQIGGRPYLVIERSYAVFPQTSGLLKLAPVLAEARIGSAANSLFDSFGRSKVVRARSNELDIAVLPVPKNINVSPWLPAKNLELVEQWPQNSPSFVQGEPVTRTLSIKAEGLTAAQLPVLPDISIDGLKQYPDQPLLNDIKNDNGITGYRLEKVALIPARAGQIILPAIDIPWWNTTTQKREVARVPARTITVTPSEEAIAASAKPAPIQQQIEPLIGQTEQAKTIDPAVETGESRLWMIMTILFATAWIATLFMWFFIARKQHPSNNKKIEPVPSIKQHYRQLKQACGKRDVADVRLNLLNWAKAYFLSDEIQNLHDLIQKMPEDVASEIKKLDAVLYGGQQLEIKFDRIAGQIEQFMRSRKAKSKQLDSSLLEPLYK